MRRRSEQIEASSSSANGPVNMTEIHRRLSRGSSLANLTNIAGKDQPNQPNQTKPTDEPRPITGSSSSAVAASDEKIPESRLRKERAQLLKDRAQSVLASSRNRICHNGIISPEARFMQWWDLVMLVSDCEEIHNKLIFTAPPVPACLHSLFHDI